MLVWVIFYDTAISGKIVLAIIEVASLKQKFV